MFVPDLVMTLTTPPAVRPNSAGAPVAMTWNSLMASSVMSTAAAGRRLLAEEAVVVIAAVEADVVEDAALAGKRDLVSVRPLHDRHTGRQRQQVLELASEVRDVFDGSRPESWPRTSASIRPPGCRRP